MSKPAKNLRYLLESYVSGHKGSGHKCPGCGKPKQFTRYVDVRTNELLPEEYGMCNKVNNCGYQLSPYHTGQSGMSYAAAVFEQFKTDNPLRNAQAPRRQSLRNMGKIATLNSPVIPPIICEIPRELVDRSIVHYEHNQLATLLQNQFGTTVGKDLLRRFQIGTSTHWTGACIFWYIDEQNRVRGGQIKLLGSNWHTVKYVDGKGIKRNKTNWVHAVMKRRLEDAGEPLPEWLQTYLLHGDKSPCLFGLPQLRTAPPDQPIAIVEAPKTAIIATACLPEFLWLAAGAKDYLNAERLAPLKSRSLLLWPDSDAYNDTINAQGRHIRGWLSKAAELRKEGFDIEVSDFLERRVTDDQRQKGLDLADFLLQPDEPKRLQIVKSLSEWTANPGSILRPNEDQLTRL